MAKKFYTLKDIVEMLNGELENSELSYRYTEQAVRSRLRYLRSKGVEDHSKPLITPKVLSYDLRTKYYTEEDVQKLRALWIGPMIAEFHEYPEDLNRLEEVDEVEVRPADSKDEEPISKLFQSASDEEAQDRLTRINRMLKEPNAKTFVALNQENEIVGWTQAKIAF